MTEPRGNRSAVVIYLSVLLLLLGMAALWLLTQYVWFRTDTFERNTCFAPHYREQAFLEVHVGMPRREVLGLLGPPVYVEKHGSRVILWYSRPLRERSRWRLKKIYLDPDGRVTSVYSNDIVPGFLD